MTAPMSERRTIVLGTLLWVTSSAIFYVFPVFLSFLGSRLSLDPSQLGTLAATESLGVALTSLFGPFWISRVGLRTSLIVGVLTCVVGNFVTAVSTNYEAVLISRFVVGLIGEGVVGVIGLLIFVTIRNVERATAIALATAALFGAATMASAAMFERTFPSIGPLAPLIGVALAVLPFVHWLSTAGRENAAAGPSPLRQRGIKREVILALLAQTIWFGAPGALWAFAEQIATDRGVPKNTTELVLSVAELAGPLGSFTAVWLGDRWGDLRPIAASTIGVMVGAVVYQSASGVVGLGLSLSIFYLLWQLGSPYQMAFVYKLDRTGSGAVAMSAAQIFGLSIGPFVAGRMMLSHGNSAVTVSTFLFALTGLALYLTSSFNARATGDSTRAWYIR